MKLNWKNTVVSAMAISLILLFITALVLYFAPKNEASAGWRFIGFNYQGWLSHFIILIFTLFGLSIILLFIVKIKSLWSDFRTKMPEFFNSREFWIAVAFVFVIFLGTTVRIFPFRLIVQGGHFFSRQNIEKTAELQEDTGSMTLQDISGKFENLSVYSITEKLKNNNLVVSGENPTLYEVAQANNITAQEVYNYIAEGEILCESGQKMTRNSKPVSERTVADAAYELDMSVNDVFRKLRERGINVNDSMMTFRDIADKFNMEPMAVYSILTGKDLQLKQGEVDMNAAKSNFAQQAAKMTVNDMLSMINQRQGLNLKSQDLIKRLESNGVLVKNPNQTLGDLATANKMNVQEILNIISTGRKDMTAKQNQGTQQGQGSYYGTRKQDKEQGSAQQGRGRNKQEGGARGKGQTDKVSKGGRNIGKATLTELAQKGNVDVDVLINALKKEGITANKNQSVDQIAQNSKRPQREIVKILRSTVKK